MSGPQCCSNPPTLNPESGVGHVEELAGFKAYVSGSLHSQSAVLLVSDVLGYEAPNLRKLADKVAAVGFYVVVPDFLYGEPFVPERSDRPLPVWIKDHGTDKAFEDAKLVIDALKSKGVSAIGAAGFCWGAKVVVELAKDALVQATVMLHPSFVTVDDIKIGTCRIFLLKNHKTKSEVDCFVKIFPKCGHGWAVRYKVDDPTAVSCAEEAHQDMLGWFTKYVK